VYKNMPRGIIALVFRCRCIGGDLTESDEVQAFKWVTGDQAKSLAYEAYAIRVLDALREDKAVVREHDGTRLICS